jgi:D-alanyl-D-alanine carboxypeptidase
MICMTIRNSDKSNQCELFLNKQIKGNKTPCIQYSIFTRDTVIFKFQSGLADIHNKIQVYDNTTFNAFSVTKTFTALAIFQLSEQGKLQIDKPVIDYLTNFQYRGDINVKQLLAHSAGIPNPIPLNWIHLIDENNSFDRNLFFKGIFEKNNSTKTKPNEKYAYSNLGYVLLGQLIEKISGLVYENYIRESIFRPLNIEPNELDFIINDTTKHAKGYHKKLSFSNAILSLLIDKSKYMDKTEGKWKSFKNFYVNGASYGGLIGNLSGFIKYIQDLLQPESKLINATSKKEIFNENFTNNGKPTQVCLGWFKGDLNGNKYFAHAGGGGGYYCEIRIYPDIGIGSVVMFNRTGMTDERILNRIDKYFIPVEQPAHKAY